MIAIRSKITILLACLSVWLCGVVIPNTAAASPYLEFYQQYEHRFSLKNHYVAHHVPSGAYQLHAREFGVNKNGPTLILMHGFPDSLHLYDRIIPKLAEHFRVIAFDFLGWGHSDTPAEYDYGVHQQIADLQAVNDYFALQHVVLVVHDMSGIPAIDWALENRTRVAGLVLLNTYYGLMSGLRPPEAIEFYATPNPQRGMIIDFVMHNDAVWLAGIEEQLNKFFTNPRARETYVPIFAHQSLNIRPAFFDLTKTLFDDVAAHTEKQYTQLSSLNLPVAIIFGNEDPYMSPEVAAEFHRVFSSSDLHLIKNAGHFVQLDKPNAVSELIEHFVEDNLDKPKEDDQEEDRHEHRE